jgi:drug/metabolite transporter (DMT)-like permease
VVLAVVASVTAYYNWVETQALCTSLKVAVAEALTPLWAAATSAAPVMWRVVSNPVNALLYIIAFSALVQYPHVMAGVVAALSGSGPPPAGT